MGAKLYVRPDRQAYRAGEVLTVYFEVVAEATSTTDDAIAIASLEVDCGGIEKVDTSWVAGGYQANVAPVEKDGRRVSRMLFKSRRLRLLSECQLACGKRRILAARLQLPQHLPPSFKGVAARYIYTLDACLTYANPIPTPNQPVSNAAAEPIPSTANSSQQDALPSSNPSQAHADSSASQLPPSQHGAPAPQPSSERPSRLGFLGGPSGPALANGDSRGPETGAPGKDPQRRVLKEVAVRLPLTIWPPPQADAAVRRIAAMPIPAGEDAQLTPITYSLGIRDVPWEFQELNLEAVSSNSTPKRAPPVSHQQLQPPLNWHRQEPLSAESKPSSSGSSSKSPFAAGSKPLERQRAQEDDALLTRSLLTADGTAALDADSPQQSMAPSVPSSHDMATEAALASDESSAEDGGRKAALSPTASAGEPVHIGGALRSWNLRFGAGMLAKLQLHPPLEGCLQPGATLAGLLDFRLARDAAARSPAAPSCLQVIVLLETEECVGQEWRPASRKSSYPSIRKVYDEHQELTPDTLLTHFMFSLPMDAPASFANPVLSLRWVLRFEFTASFLPAQSAWSLSAPSRTTEQISWALPVLVRHPDAA
ncbi:hypothetical protein WJX74_003029 [Apatococcus lobatus]|uniref:Rgp1-domain-containing protein n=1 Tax=Apatococcus lobatus TaxID=904363 RepID=A0AAW1SEC7_9CHLO